MLQNIILTNYRIFKGENCITLAASYPRLITTISTISASGKTTLMEAVYWCLYGESLHLSKENRLNIEVSSALAENEEAMVGVSLTFLDDGFKVELRRKELVRKQFGRLYVASKSTFIDGLEVGSYEFNRIVQSILKKGHAFAYFWNTDLAEKNSIKRILCETKKYVSHLYEIRKALFEKRGITLEEVLFKSHQKIFDEANEFCKKIGYDKSVFVWQNVSFDIVSGELNEKINLLSENDRLILCVSFLLAIQRCFVVKDGSSHFFPIIIDDIWSGKNYEQFDLRRLFNVIDGQQVLLLAHSNSWLDEQMSWLQGIGYRYGMYRDHSEWTSVSIEKQ